MAGHRVSPTKLVQPLAQSIYAAAARALSTALWASCAPDFAVGQAPGQGGAGGTGGFEGTAGNTGTSGDGTGGSGAGGDGTGVGGWGGGGGGAVSDRFFRLTGTGFDPYAGSMIRVEGVAEGGTTEEIAAVEVADDGTFTAEGTLTPEKAYQIVYFADINWNNSCDEAPTDHVWELAVDAAPGGTPAELNVTHNTDFAPCL